MKPSLPLQEVWPWIRKLDWQDENFSLGKAYVCVLFSELAYLRIPLFELSDANRVNIIPCSFHREVSAVGESFDFDSFVQAFDIADTFAIETRFAVTVGVRTPKVIFISIRGTKYLYDWIANLDARRSCTTISGDKICFHRGFFREFYSYYIPTLIRLYEFLKEKPVPIYVTGHSLGGAIAAVMHAMQNSAILGVDAQQVIENLGLQTHSCYTFGMPRYGNANAMSAFPQPFLLYNEKDIVPTIPPRWMGFENCSIERKLDGQSIDISSRRETLNFASWISRLAFDKGISDHDIELYRERIKGNLDIAI